MFRKLCLSGKSVDEWNIGEETILILGVSKLG